MNYHIITLFPELFEGLISSTLVSKAIQKDLISVEVQQFRDFAINTQGQVDDSPYGGGGGMVARVDACVSAIEHAKLKLPNAPVVLFTPRGRPLTQNLVKELNAKQLNGGGFILFCSRYEGVDERFAKHWVDYEISVGDSVYMGGEVPAMAFLEASSRLIPGVLGNEKSIEEESFELNGLEYPHYTKPRDFRGVQVPEILLSGNHAEIEKWRKEQSIVDTSLRRPDLVSEELSDSSPSQEKEIPPIYLGLMHYPVVDKQDRIVTSSITNLDVHDIARSVKTFNLDGFFIIHPSRVLRTLIQRVCDHWASGAGLDYNPNRSEALETITSVSALDDAIRIIEANHGVVPRIVVTSARPGDKMLEYSRFRSLMPAFKEPLLILFGTAWGMDKSIMQRADYRLNPICGPGEYNHLSVRSAVAISLDRLFGS